MRHCAVAAVACRRLAVTVAAFNEPRQCDDGVFSLRQPRVGLIVALVMPDSQLSDDGWAELWAIYFPYSYVGPLSPFADTGVPHPPPYPLQTLGRGFLLLA